jgi:hypothetical protein
LNSIADLYLPPDTPTQSARVFSQIRKNKRIKKTRTIERLKAYTLEKLQDTRKDQARTVIPASLPRPITPYEVIEFIEGEDFLVDYTEDIVELLEMARRVKENGKESVLLNPPPLPTTAEEEEEANLPEKIEYKSKIEVRG